MNFYRLYLSVLAVVGISALAGCQSLDDLDRVTYQRACDNLGIQRGTDAYDQCVLQQQALDKQGQQEFLNREALKGKL